MVILIALIIIVALGVAILSKGRKIGLALVILALAVAMIWRDNFSNGDWVIFAIIFVAGLIYTRDNRYRSGSGARAGGGLAVLVLTAVLVSNFSVPNALSSALGSSREASIKAMNEDLKGEYDSAEARLKAIEDKNREQDSRLDALEAADKALEEKDKAHDKALADLTTKVTGIVTTAPPIDLNRQQIADALAEDFVDQGYGPDDVTAFEINWDENIHDVGDNPFVNQVIDSSKELKARLSQSTAQAKAVRAHVVKATPKSEHSRLLNGRGFVPVQFNKQVCLDGNTFFIDGKAEPGSTNCHEAGDVIWVYVGSNGKVYWDASVRADCGNPGMTAPPRPTKEKKSKQDKPSKQSNPGTPEKPREPGTPTPTPPGSTKTPKPTPTPSKTTPPSTPTPKPTPSCPPGGNGSYGCPKPSAPPPPGQSPRPSGTTTASPKPKPTHSGPVLTPKPSPTTTRPPSDSHTPEPSSSPVLPSPTASGTIGDG